jgi:hypothetical protein
MLGVPVAPLGLRMLWRAGTPSVVDVYHHRRIFCFALRRLASILLILVFLGIGTGAVEYLHNLDHQGNSQSHDESNCPTHAILRASAVLSAAPPLLCISDAQPDRVATISSSLPSQHTPARIDCRGPPAC